MQSISGGITSISIFDVKGHYLNKYNFSWINKSLPINSILPGYLFVKSALIIFHGLTDVWDKVVAVVIGVSSLDMKNAWSWEQDMPVHIKV